MLHSRVKQFAVKPSADAFVPLFWEYALAGTSLLLRNLRTGSTNENRIILTR